MRPISATDVPPNFCTIRAMRALRICLRRAYARSLNRPPSNPRKEFNTARLPRAARGHKYAEGSSHASKGSYSKCPPETSQPSTPKTSPSFPLSPTNGGTRRASLNRSISLTNPPSVYTADYATTLMRPYRCNLQRFECFRRGMRRRPIANHF